MIKRRSRALCVLFVGVTAAVITAVTTAANAATGEQACRQLSPFSAEELTTFQFESATDAAEGLPEGERFQLRHVEVVTQNVFETETNWLERLANRYHVTTRDEAVLAVLPMRPGDAVTARELAEAERILRRKVYFYDARVIPRRLCGDLLDVFVVTRDVWTLMPRISLTRTGSENEVGFGIVENNLLGSGKYVELGYEKDNDRRGIVFAFGDPNVAGSRWALDLAVVDNDDGESVAAVVEYPFFALDSRRAFAVSVDNDDREEGLYFLGDEVWEYRARTSRFRVTGGWSPGLEGRFVNRFLVGYAHEEYEFGLPAELLAAFPGIDAPERDYSYPFIAYQRIEDDFDTRVNVDRVQRTEDLALGMQLYAELGLSHGSGGTGDNLIGRLEYADAAWLTERHLAAFNTWLDGYYDLDADRVVNLVFGVAGSYRWQQSGNWSLLVRGSASAAHNPTLDEQLLLGGEEGLRGYPNRYQTGDRRFLLTIEERYYADVYPLRMFRLGGAVFLDVGRAWYEGQTPEWLPEDRSDDHFGVLANAGFGLRLESTRTRRDQLVHLDVAFPMRGGPDVRDVEITLTVKQSL